jgi:hypothetical protein
MKCKICDRDMVERYIGCQCNASFGCRCDTDDLVREYCVDPDCAAKACQEPRQWPSIATASGARPSHS